MINDFFIFNGENSIDHGLTVADADIFPVPNRVQDVIKIPGRNGSLILDTGCYDDVKLTYKVNIRNKLPEHSTDICDWLSRAKGYQRLESSIQPDSFRLAYWEGNSSIDQLFTFRSGTYEFNFKAKAQLFLKSGENVVEFSESGELNNMTSHIALPLVRVYGSGTVTIGSISITTSTTEDYTDIDCDRMIAYHGTTSLDSSITMTNGKMFQLSPGVNSITLGSGISRVEITPRWWTL